mmetsp:Transcript_9789/g.19862  ORF Transcript_9789/g.19862 Transcript_9789/m.19862 type:complete len:1268 (+) Transcript_9789:132-3935(+)
MSSEMGEHTLQTAPGGAPLSPSPPPSSSYDYVFGFGSIMNTSTHAVWKTTSSPSTESSSSSSSSLPGVIATISKEFGYRRQWSFRSSTGFTALGVGRSNSSSSNNSSEGSDINGVIFQVPTNDMPDFDRREVGYTKIRVPLEYVTIMDNHHHSEHASSSYHEQANFAFTPNDNIWLYVPLPNYIHYADETHPLLQSYVDTVLQGCLEWGGPTMAEQFILTTGGWSEYFLNDTPSSRRPWLFRKEYNTIDELLKKYEELTYYAERRHPEEFASAFNQRMRGSWNLPRRNPNFTGRDGQLDQLRLRLVNQDDRGKQQQRVVVRVDVAGMGGVGKSQLVTEYCYRNFPAQYGLVIWLNSESADSLVADYRSLLSDMAMDVDVGGVSDNADMNKSTDEIVGEVKTRLFRSRVPWLLVFDNLEDHDLLNDFVPRGAGVRGHVVVTTRHIETEAVDSHGTLILGCFDISESLELLRRSAGLHNVDGEKNTLAATELCKMMGNLPLALGMAAAYMRRCDVQCVEYLDRYIASEKTGQSLYGKVENYSLSVASSMSLSLGEIEKESPTTCQVLRLLSFLGPDQITKWLLRNLLSSKKKMDAHLSELNKTGSGMNLSSNSSAMICGIVLAGAALILPACAKDGRRVGLCVGLVAASMLIFSSSATDSAATEQQAHHEDIKRSASISNAISAFEYEESDVAWDLLKSFSLLSVKEGKGSVHRLLQQAMRTCQSEEESQRNLIICIDALRSLWTFKPEEVESWKEALQILDHVKCVVAHALEFELDAIYILKAAQLSMEAGVFSAMALNAFVEAQYSLHLALSLLEKAKLGRNSSSQRLKAEVLHELGRVYRYQGSYNESERSLLESLEISQQVSRKDLAVRKYVADTLHELGVLEVKKHNLDSAAQFLQRSLELRQSLTDTESDSVNASCAATLHQLAAVYVARKPPSLEKAKALLQDALKMCRQIGQRAATLKQLARVTIRQGYLEKAEIYLEQALELYLELYGDNKLHINIASVKFQQGALALQREQFDEAWLHFSECLRIRRHVYAYARQVGVIGTEVSATRKSSVDTNPIHLEISVVLHELGVVGFAQGRFSQAFQMLLEERAILENLHETTSHSNRVYQARLTCLTWLRKCAKELGDESEAEKYTKERTAMKKEAGLKTKEKHLVSESVMLQHKVIDCRLLARQFALEKSDSNIVGKEKLLNILAELKEEISLAPPESMARAATRFRDTMMIWIDEPISKRRVPILKACDSLRDTLRAHGIQVVDSMIQNKR